jgi:cobalt/nickel transport system permease protein
LNGERRAHRISLAIGKGGWAMHISDGILSQSAAGQAVLAGGAALALAGAAIGLRRLDYERVPRVAVLASAFFIASLVHFRIGPTSAHLVLNGLLGVVLGWAAFPALLIALFLQAIFFGHGGITTLGLNAFNLASPALLVFLMLGRPIRASRSRAAAFALGFAAGALALWGAALLTTAELVLSGGEFEQLARVVLLASLPLGLVEGLVTGAAVTFLRQVRPELLEPPTRISGGKTP